MPTSLALIETLTETCSSDLLTYAFEGPIEYDRDNKPLYIEAEDPSRCLTASQSKCLVRKLIAGFRHAGVKKGDRIVVHLPNTVPSRP